MGKRFIHGDFRIMPTKQDIIDYINGIEGTSEELAYAYEQILYTCWFQKHKLQPKIDETIDIDYVINQEPEKHE
jgi:hypothetical protein